MDGWMTDSFSGRGNFGDNRGNHRQAATTNVVIQQFVLLTVLYCSHGILHVGLSNFSDFQACHAQTSVTNPTKTAISLYNTHHRYDILF